MNSKYLSIVFLLAMCSSAQADWFLRGTQNNWGTTPMVAAGTNTVEVKNVAFPVAGSVKFDRLGDWSQNYGIGGANGGNIPVAAGTWNIKFFTDTKNWTISRVTQYHLRGTHNAWAEGDLMTLVAGSDSQYEICRDFGAGTATNSSRFKVDPSGGWGADSFPSTDYPASGFTKIVVDGNTRKIVSVDTRLRENCKPKVGVLVFEKPGPFNLSVGDVLDNRVKITSVFMTVMYHSNNSAVATVAAGRVTVVGPGTATIIAIGAGSESLECIRIMCRDEGSYIINALPVLQQ